MKIPAFFILIIAILFPRLANATDAAGCAAYKPAKTRININFLLPDPIYDFQRDIASLNKDHKQHEEWLAANNMQSVWKSSDMETEGRAETGLGMVSKAAFIGKAYDTYGTYYCPYVTEINIELMLRTIIVIPTKFPQGGCKHALILEHELKHHKTNTDVATEYRQKLERDLLVIVDMMENTEPYVKRQNVDAAMERLKTGLKDAIEIYLTDAMMTELARRNGLVDSPQEYMEGSVKLAQCPN